MKTTQPAQNNIQARVTQNIIQTSAELHNKTSYWAGSDLSRQHTTAALRGNTAILALQIFPQDSVTYSDPQ